MRGKAIPISLALGMGIFAGWVSASDKSWDAPRGGAFNTRGNWATGGAPGSKDAAVFDLSSAYTVTFTANAASRQLEVGNDKVLLDLKGHTYDLAVRSSSILLGLNKGDVSRITLRGGTLTAGDCVIGSAAGSSGNVSVTGGAWKNVTLTIGAAGSGGMTVTGGQVTSFGGSVGGSTGGQGNVTLNGTTAAWQVVGNLQAGNSSRGSANIAVGNGASLDVGGLLDIRKTAAINLNGGTLSAGGIAKAGKLNFASGTLELTGTSSNPSRLLIGKGGLLGSNVTLNANQTVNVASTVQSNTGSLLAMHGGSLTAGHFIQGGEVRLDGGSTVFGGNQLDNSGLLHGSGRVGFSSVKNTGEIRASAGDNLVFTGSVLNSGSINVSAGATAELDWLPMNDHGGTINNSGSLVAPGDLYNGGTVNFSGSAQFSGNFLNTRGQIRVIGPSATFTGYVSHSEGAGFFVGPSSVATFAGTVTQGGSFTGGGSLVFQGTYDLNPPEPLRTFPTFFIPANVNIEGSVAFGPAGDLLLRLGRRGADQVIVSNTVHLAAVDLQIEPKFVPPVGSKYTLLTASHIDYGGPINVPDRFRVDEGPTALTVTFVPEPAGGLLMLGAIGGLCLRRRRK
jgi:T5SS/PEP-CTERM-associated repeat protein